MAAMICTCVSARRAGGVGIAVGGSRRTRPLLLQGPLVSGGDRHLAPTDGQRLMTSARLDGDGIRLGDAEARKERLHRLCARDGRARTIDEIITRDAG
jgi:hypothetical protein